MYKRYVYSTAGSSNAKFNSVFIANSGNFYVRCDQTPGSICIAKINADYSVNWAVTTSGDSDNLRSIVVTSDESYVYSSSVGVPLKIFQLNATNGALIKIYSA